MKLGLTHDEVRLEEFTSAWSEEFKRVKVEIMKNVDVEAKQIEHIGSTAITDMPAKPIIDIVIGIDDVHHVEESVVLGLKKSGFLQLRVERPEEIVFATFTDDTFQVKTHYVHLVSYRKELWQNLIFFRDHLNAHQEARVAYEKIKRDYVQHSTTGITEYTDYKEQFVKAIYKQRSQEG
ncbi:MAG TPA: GrpB family protein [Bacillota bacterium]|nr:GrpB family protein [Bacillota bacterium]